MAMGQVSATAADAMEIQVGEAAASAPIAPGGQLRGLALGGRDGGGGFGGSFLLVLAE